MSAFHHRLLLVDLNRGSSRAVSLPAALLKRFPGGPGLSTALLLAAELEWPADEPLVLAPCALVGAGITTAARAVVSSRSPLTGFLGESLVSGKFAVALRETGFDAVLLRGKTATSSVLAVSDDRIELRAAPGLAGATAEVAAGWARQQWGPGGQTLASGPAADTGTAFAALTHSGRHAGRGGMGAALARLGLKAVTISGDQPVRPALPDRMAELASLYRSRAGGRSTARYRRLGTSGNLLTFERLGILPVQNFRGTRYDSAARISGEGLASGRPRLRTGCHGCAVQCEYRFTTGAEKVRAEYESLFAMGPLPGLADPEAILHHIALCDAMGIDTLSAGGALAWLAEAQEAGAVTPLESGGVDLRDGRTAPFQVALEAMADPGHALFDLLSGGVRRAARLAGSGSEHYAMHVKGMELPGYEPRALPSLALGLAVGPRGACHNRSSAYDADLAPGPKPDPVAAQIESEDRATTLDTLAICKFLRHAIEDVDQDGAALLHALTGDAWTAEGVAGMAGATAAIRRLYNIHAGLRRSDDTLPPRLLLEPISDGPRAGERLDSANLQQQVTGYYNARGWDPLGVPADEHSTDLQILVSDLQSLLETFPG